jgi:hypothetical protein
MPYSPPGYDPGIPGGAVTPPPVAPSAGVGPWAPAVWSPLIWPAVVWPGRVGGAVVVAEGRDWDILIDVRDRLDALGVFDVVYLAGEPTDPRERASDGLLAVVSPAGGDSDDDAMSGTEVDIIRVFRFQVTIANRANSQGERVNALGRAANRARNAIDGKSLAGLTFPAMTGFKPDRYERPNHPDSTITLDGSCTYMIPGYAAHNVGEGALLVE